MVGIGAEALQTGAVAAAALQVPRERVREVCSIAVAMAENKEREIWQMCSFRDRSNCKKSEENGGGLHKCRAYQWVGSSPEK